MSRNIRGLSKALEPRKAGSHKYIRREGAKGNYRYTYTEPGKGGRAISLEDDLLKERIDAAAHKVRTHEDLNKPQTIDTPQYTSFVFQLKGKDLIWKLQKRGEKGFSVQSPKTFKNYKAMATNLTSFLGESKKQTRQTLAEISTGQRGKQKVAVVATQVQLNKLSSEELAELKDRANEGYSTDKLVSMAQAWIDDKDKK